MAEWSIAAVLKTAGPQGPGGSNPSLSAKRAGTPFNFICKGIVNLFLARGFQPLRRFTLALEYEWTRNSERLPESLDIPTPLAVFRPYPPAHFCSILSTRCSALCAAFSVQPAELSGSSYSGKAS